MRRAGRLLHLAVHGFAADVHPEACTLILADCSQRPERELLPYRRIRELDETLLLEERENLLDLLL